MKFTDLVRGNSRLMVDGQDGPVHAEAGDVFLHSGQGSFVLASDLEAVPVEAASVFSPTSERLRNLAAVRIAFRSAVLCG